MPVNASPELAWYSVSRPLARSLFGEVNGVGEAGVSWYKPRPKLIAGRCFRAPNGHFRFTSGGPLRLRRGPRTSKVFYATRAHPDSGSSFRFVGRLPSVQRLHGLWATCYHFGASRRGALWRLCRRPGLSGAVDVGTFPSTRHTADAGRVPRCHPAKSCREWLARRKRKLLTHATSPRQTAG